MAQERSIQPTASLIDDQRTPTVELIVNDPHFFEQMVHLLPDAFYIYDLLADRNVFINESGAPRLGLSTAAVQMEQPSAASLMHPDDLLRLRVYHTQQAAQLADGQVAEFEYRLRLADGAWHWYRSRDKVFRRTPDGRVHQIIGLATEITEHKAAMQQLHFQAAVLAQISDAVIAIDNAERITWLNCAAAQQYQVDADAVIGQPLSVLHTYHWLQPTDEAACYTALAETGSWRGENIHIKHTGEAITVESTVSVLTDDAGQQIGLLAVVRNISERKRLEQQLAFHAGLLDQAYDAIIATDVELNITAWNRGAAEMYGWSAAEVLGKNAPLVTQSVLPPATRALALQQLAESDHYRTEVITHHRDGTALLVEGRTVTMRDVHGHVLGYMSISRDLRERKAIEEGLRASEARLRLATQVAGLAIVETDYVANLSHLSAEAAALFGLGPNALTLPRTEVHALFHPDDWAQLGPRINAALDPTGSGELAVEQRLVRPDGKLCWLSVREQVFFSAPDAGPPHPVRGLLVAIDVTERKQVEETLRHQEAFLRQIADNVPGLVGYVGKDERYRFVNATFETWFVRSRQQILAGSVRTLLGDEEHVRLNAYRQRALAGETVTYEDQYTYPDGVTRTIWGRYQPDFAAAGRVAGFYIFVMDISERKAAEDALRASEARLEVILQNIPAAVYLLTPDHRYLFVNRRFEQNNQITNAEICGLSVYDRFPWEVADALAANEKQVLAQRGPVEFEEYAPRQGDAHYFATVKTPLFDAAGEPYAILGISIDITARKHAEQALRTSEERYRTLFESMDEGFCILAMIFDAAGRAVDYRFLEANPAFERFTGLQAVVGKTARELVPNLEDHWFEIYGEVARSRTPRRFVEGSPAMARWFEVHAFPFGPPEEAQVALLFNNITERRQAEETLRQNHALLQGVINATPSGIYVRDLTGRYLLVNQMGAAMVGLTPEAMIGQRYHTLFSPETIADITAADQQVLATGELRVEEFDWSPADVVYSLHSIRLPYRDWADNIVGVLNVVHNITDRKRQERHQQFLSELGIQLRMLDDTDSLMQQVVHRLGEYMGVTSCRVNEIELAHQQFTLRKDWCAPTAHFEPKITPASYPLRELAPPPVLAELAAGRTVVVANTFHDPRTAPVADAYQSDHVQAFVGLPILRQGRWSATLSVKTQGERQWRQDEIDLLEAVAGQFSALLEKVHAEEALRRSEKQARHQLAEIEAIYATAPVGLCLVDPDLRYVRINETLAAINGRTISEQLGRTLRETGTEATFRLVEPLYRRVIEKGEPLLNQEIHVDAYGHPAQARDWLANYYPLKNADGGVVGVNAVIVEITERKRQERQLQELNTTLEQRVQERTAELQLINRELEQFTYAAAHDLKSPLRGIQQLALWISQDAAATLPAESQRHLQQLRQRVQRLERLLDDMLAYSRVGRIHYPPERVDLANLVTTTFDLLSPPAGFRLHIAGHLPVITTARTPLELILRNLISNAIKHHHQPATGNVIIQMRELADGFEWRVTDDGPGIAPEFHNRIFEMFQILQPRHEVEGSGIGLTMTKRIVESYGGQIHVESAMNQGATFCFTWPILRSP